MSRSTEEQESATAECTYTLNEPAELFFLG